MQVCIYASIKAFILITFGRKHSNTKAFTMSSQNYNNVCKLVKNLSNEEKLSLANGLFGGDDGKDNYGQIIIYTNMTYNSDGTIREMTEKDFEDNNE